MTGTIFKTDGSQQNIKGIIHEEDAMLIVGGAVKIFWINEYKILLVNENPQELKMNIAITKIMTEMTGRLFPIVGDAIICDNLQLI